MSESDVKTFHIEPNVPFYLDLVEDDPRIWEFHNQMAKQGAEYTCEYDHPKLAYKVVVKTPNVKYVHGNVHILPPPSK